MILGRRIVTLAMHDNDDIFSERGHYMDARFYEMCTSILYGNYIGIVSINPSAYSEVVNLTTRISNEFR